MLFRSCLGAAGGLVKDCLYCCELLPACLLYTSSFENANYFLKLFEQLWNDKKKLQEVTDVVIENRCV